MTVPLNLLTWISCCSHKREIRDILEIPAKERKKLQENILNHVRVPYNYPQDIRYL